MNKRVAYFAAAVLALHGLVHVLGPVAYFELATIEDLPYKTTLLGGTVDVGDAGIRLFGLLWAVAGAGFVCVAAGLVADWEYWQPSLLAVTVFSLILTVADYTVAYAGIVLNLAILGGLAYTTMRGTGS